LDEILVEALNNIIAIMLIRSVLVDLIALKLPNLSARRWTHWNSPTRIL